MDTNIFHLADGSAYALTVRKGKPDLATRKRLAAMTGYAVICPGCERKVRTSDDMTTDPEGFVRAVAEADRPNGPEFVGVITVTDEDGRIVKAPYSEATVALCPACNGSGARAVNIDRILRAHEARIREVGRRVR